MKIKIDDLSGREIAELLTEHMEEMHLHSPKESIHALDLHGLRQPEITFWSIWENGELLGCGALNEMNGRHAEIKSMRVTYRHQGKGIANIILEHLLAEAKHRGYQQLSLETGSMDAFNRARKLYEKYGFDYCGPFADYREDPNSVFMTKKL
ncbi:GNAT family N-acetyltransferase [Aliikangiella coralliicola]|uniref:GNAT family N-acetyltransferase n=1 Tax=Aliikangiella coralliicola TaxID=2592383 RepID=A0A545UDR8_9GAMM|nr:GNAT family N-acetyltransferase [Aliikangiella coralliicola]TQV87611.1 GNAT family N-acetyltransferase [Aliikangiella coralliicola]